MARLGSICATALLLVASAHAHFTLRTPPSIGFDDDKEDQDPCGGFTPDFSKNAVDFHVGGQPIGTSQSHPSARLLYRATLDQSARGGWTQLYPILLQNSIGLICIPSVPAPEAWVGKKGVVGIVANGDDGLLYQCITVNFVSGRGTVDGNTCSNSSSEVVTTSDSQLAALASGSISSPAAQPNGTAPASNPSETQKPNAAGGTWPRESLALGGMAAILAMAGPLLL